MFKKWVILIISLIFISHLNAQTGTKTTKTPAYLMHTVQFGETLSKIALDYQVTVDDILKNNPSLTAHSLMPEQIIRIPNKLKKKIEINQTKSESSTTKSENKSKNATNPSSITVETGQTLYSISKKYNVSVEDLVKWNNLTNYDLKVGSQLLIKNTKTSVPNKLTTSTAKKELIPKQENKELVAKSKEEVYKAQELKPKTNHQPISTEPIVEEESVQIETKDIPVSDNENQKELSGIFKSYITNLKNIQKIKGTAAPMTTTLGTVENTYFAMHRTLSIGTIIKIKNLVNSKVVYAKVIGKLPDIQENKNVIIRYSLGVKKDLMLLSGKNYVQIEFPE